MARPLDPVSLQLFVAVCEEGSLARAAEREALVPSALSKRVAALEAETGVALLVRRRRGVEPTAAGEALLRRAREVLLAMDAARAELGAFEQGAQGSVRLLASPSAMAEVLPDDLASFMAEHPRMQVRAEETVSPTIVRGLREGTADLGVLWDVGDLDGLEFVARIDVGTDSNGDDKNDIRAAVTPDHREYAALMGSVAAAPAAASPQFSSAPATGGRPAWAQ